MKTIELTVERRATKGKNAARRTRANGKIPAVVYGAGRDTVPITVDARSLSDAFRGGAGENAIFLLKLQGSDQTRHAMIRDFQRDPLSRRPMHLDFVRVLMDTKIRVRVPVEIVGVAKGVKTDGGILDFVTREIEIECLPGNIPEHLPVDVTELSIGDALRVSDVPAPEGVEVVDDAEKVVLHVAHPAHEEVPAPPEIEAVAEEPAEPEVLRKGKAATEEEGEEKKEK
ncbi:MAG TPA: 50S ribosomal protein L25 [Thermoanaerobaculia bacterium]|jgi:large subunit ribosomal protein L25|nr:50S ribosomal protein L25 [Thermoanaerobaculia bacterium]